MKANLHVLGLILGYCLSAVIITGCGQDDVSFVSVVSVDPPNESTIEPDLPAITVTFDGPPEGFELIFSGDPEDIPFELSGNTVTFFGPFELGGLDLYFKWLGREERFHLDYSVRSPAVVSLPRDKNEVNLLPPWPANVKNFEPGPSGDIFRFEFPIYIDRPLGYDLEVGVFGTTTFVERLRGGLGSDPRWEEGRLQRFIIEEGKTEVLCVYEFEIDNWHHHLDYYFEHLRLELESINISYKTGRDDILVYLENLRN